MPNVALTPHLFRFFPTLEKRELTVPSGSVAEVLVAVDKLAPGFSDYLLDEHGALRQHVNICINQTLIVDRSALSDRVSDDATVFVFQALSGG